MMTAALLVLVDLRAVRTGLRGALVCALFHGSFHSGSSHRRTSADVFYCRKNTVPAIAHSEEGEKKTTASVAVHCWMRNPMGLLAGRLGLKKLAFLQERDNWFSAASAK
jgi:hypothetical protein